MQRERYIDFTRDQAFKNIMDYSHWRANPRLVRAIVDESGRDDRLAAGRGASCSPMPRSTCPRLPGPITSSRARERRSSRLWSRRRRAKGSRSCPATPVTGLLKEGGRICGVVVDDDGEEVEVAARAVMVATGGFANNKEWIKKYCGLRAGSRRHSHRQHREDG